MGQFQGMDHYSYRYMRQFLTLCMNETTARGYSKTHCINMEIRTLLASIFAHGRKEMLIFLVRAMKC